MNLNSHGFKKYFHTLRFGIYCRFFFLAGKSIPTYISLNVALSPPPVFASTISGFRVRAWIKEDGGNKKKEDENHGNRGPTEHVFSWSLVGSAEIFGLWLVYPLAFDDNTSVHLNATRPM